MAKVVIAPDSFKGSLAAAGVAEAIAAGWREQHPNDEFVLLPLADGGEGTLDALAAATPTAQRMPVEVTGPHGRTVRAEWLLLAATSDRSHTIGVVELANTSGIELLGDELLPFDAHTFGLGEALRAALDYGVDELVVGVGSSASTDGGMGMLRALGAEFFDSQGKPVALGAAGLLALDSIDLSGLRALPSHGVTVLSDVTAPLCGATGAAAVFGPQKGLEPEDIDGVDGALQHYAELMHSGDLHASAPGAGAAGGTGFGLLAWGANLVPGAAHIADMLGLAEHCAEADVVITGEGKFDEQSLLGKVPGMILQLAEAAGTPVALIAGHIAASEPVPVDAVGVESTGTASSISSAESPLGHFVDAVALTSLAPSADAAIASPAQYVREAASRVARRLTR